MKNSIVSLLIPFLILTSPEIAAQDDWEGEYQFKSTFGLAGGIGLINPETINKQLEFMNNSMDMTIEPLRSMTQGAFFVKLRPKDAPYILMRIDASAVSRKYDYAAAGFSADSIPTGRFNVANTTRWTTYGFSIGAGTNIPKTPVDIEIAGIYALGFISEEGNIGGTRSYSYSSNGDGYGFLFRLSPRFQIAPGFSLMIEFTYRGLIVSSFTDSRGREVQDFEFNQNGFVIGGGVTYTIN